MFRCIIAGRNKCYKFKNVRSFLPSSGRIPFKDPRSKIRWYSSSSDSEKMSKEGAKNFKSVTDKEWKDRLTSEQFEVCRLAATELPFSGIYTDHFEEGLYNCVCCGAVLFSSETKYSSGCGWPSFKEPYSLGTEDGKKKTNIKEREDNSHGRKRTEVICAQCEAHLGHVFTDGPPPLGLRYCINSVALQFQKKTLD